MRPPLTIVIGISKDRSHYCDWSEICCKECYYGPYLYKFDNARPKVDVIENFDELITSMGH